MTYFSESELVINAKGEIYHLGIKPENLAQKIILVGDQDRVGLVSNFFEEITHKSQHREFICHTGIYKQKEITVLSTGIGTDNIDIVVNELDALVNIDLKTRTEKAEKTSLDIVRIGTCGIVQDAIPIESFILSTDALGIDNVGHFYQRTLDESTLALEEEIKKHVLLPKNVIPYLATASKKINERLDSSSVKKGITISSSGFYGPQGRQLRIPLASENMLTSFSSFSAHGKKFANLEMECSALFTLANSLGHEATAICLGIANRKKKEFSENYSQKIVELIKYVLDKI